MHYRLNHFLLAEWLAGAVRDRRYRRILAVAQADPTRALRCEAASTHADRVRARFDASWAAADLLETDPATADAYRFAGALLGQSWEPCGRYTDGDCTSHTVPGLPYCSPRCAITARLEN